ncbi:redox-sensitive transcriptional activator SoxR [Streptomyces chattanoogensis]
MREPNPDHRELTVGALSSRSGVAVSALHFYERQKLITSRRTSRNQRRYKRETLRRLALIRLAQRLGIPLSEVAEVLSTQPDNRTPTRDDWQRLSGRWQAELELRILQLQQLRDRFAECIGCGCLSLERCAMANPGDDLAAQGSGPQLLGTYACKPGAKG